MRCRECGGKMDYSHIPEDIRAAGERVGLPKPVWYAGPLHCPRYKRKKTLGDLAKESRKKEDE